MGRYRVCKTFTVESGHMLSKHPGSCRYPHGHTRTIEVVISAESLDQNDMVVDFKVIKLLAKEHIERYDHRMAMNTEDKLHDVIKGHHPDSVISFEGVDPTTEVIAKEIFDFLTEKLAQTSEVDGYLSRGSELKLERIRVFETPSSWAEYRI